MEHLGYCPAGPRDSVRWYQSHVILSNKTRPLQKGKKTALLMHFEGEYWER